MEHIKSWDDMNITELNQVIRRLENETFDTEWQNEFTRLELRELRNLINQKTNKIILM